MPLYLTAAQIYRLIQRELPEDVYADGPPSAFLTTADSFATAETFETVYGNQEVIYENEFPQTADEKITDWEVKVFGSPLDSSFTLQQRRDLILMKLREQPTINLFFIMNSILGYLPTGTPVQFWQQCKATDQGWKLSVSTLNQNTFLGGFVRFQRAGYNYCNPNLGDGWFLGKKKLNVGTYLTANPNAPQDFTQQQWLAQQAHAYTYIVRVFGYTLPASVRTTIDQVLTKREPARSKHVIVDNQVLANYGLVYNKTNVDSTTTLDCLYTDNSSTTGLSGWSRYP